MFYKFVDEDEAVVYIDSEKVCAVDGGLEYIGSCTIYPGGIMLSCTAEEFFRRTGLYTKLEAGETAKRAESKPDSHAKRLYRFSVTALLGEPITEFDFNNALYKSGFDKWIIDNSDDRCRPVFRLARIAESLDDAVESAGRDLRQWFSSITDVRLSGRFCSSEEVESLVQGADVQSESHAKKLCDGLRWLVKYAEGLGQPCPVPLHHLVGSLQNGRYSAAYDAVDELERMLPK